MKIGSAQIVNSAIEFDDLKHSVENVNLPFVHLDLSHAEDLAEDLIFLFPFPVVPGEDTKADIEMDECLCRTRQIKSYSKIIFLCNDFKLTVDRIPSSLDVFEGPFQANFSARQIP
jgi:hypothetical protein